MQAPSGRTLRREWILVSILAAIGGIIALTYVGKEYWQDMPMANLVGQIKFKVQSVIADGTDQRLAVDAQSVLQQLASDKPLERLASLERIQERSTVEWSHKVLPALIETIEKDDAEAVRYQAALTILGFSSLARDAKPVMFQALGDPSGNVRTVAAGFLVKFGKETEAQLVHEMKSPDPKRCAAAAMALSHYDASWITQAVPRLRDLGRHDDAFIRQHVAMALGNTVGVAAIPTLQQMLADPIPQVRANAVDSIGLLATQSKQSMMTLKPLLNDESPMVRSSVIQALGHFPLEDTIVEAISEHSKQEEDPETCEVIRRTCIRLESLKQQEASRRHVLHP